MSTEAALSALELLATPPGAPLQQGANNEEVQLIEESRPWVFGPTVVGWGASEKITAGTPAGAAALKLYVTRKIATRDLARKHRIPASVTIPGAPESVAVDVEAIGVQRPESFIGPVRPCPPGFSIGLPGGESGTLGCIVHDAAGSRYILSNSHIIANYGLAAGGTPIIQPGPDDGGASTDAIAQYSASVEFDFNPGFNNQCDAAIGLVGNAAEVEPGIPRIGIPALSAATTEPLSVGQSVQKVGRTTEYTTGVIKDLNYRTLISYPKPGGGFGTVGFRDQVLCSKYSSPGDSGSLVCAMNGVPIGLHWAGSTVTSVFSPIAVVLALLGVSLT
jgi:hypothetical protein